MGGRLPWVLSDAGRTFSNVTLSLILSSYHHITISSYHHIIISSYAKSKRHFSKNFDKRPRIWSDLLYNRPKSRDVCQNSAKIGGSLFRTVFVRFWAVSDRFRVISNRFGPFFLRFGPFRTVFFAFRIVSDRFGSISDRFGSISDRWRSGQI